jgi:hypothetical protein
VQRSLPEINEAKAKGALPFRFYALHRGGEHEKARKIITGQDAKGHPWGLDFVWSTPAFERQLGGVVGLPSYYVLDKQGRVRAVIKGHTKHTLETLAWLVKEVEKRH